MEAPQKTKNRTTIQYSNSTPRYISRKKKQYRNTNLKWHMHPNIHSSIIYNSQDMEATQVQSTDSWIKKMWTMCVCVYKHTHSIYTYRCIYICIYIQNEILLSHKKEQNTTICSKVDGLRVMLREISQTEKDKYCMTLLTCGI